MLRKPFATIFNRRWLKTSIADLRKGDWIELENGKGPVVIHNINSSHSGRGSRSFLMSVKDPKSESITAIKPTARDTFEKLEMRDEQATYMYTTGDSVCVMNEKTFEERFLPLELVKSNVLSLLENGMSVKIRLAQNTPVGLLLPRLVTCTVADVFAHSSTDKKAWTVVLEGGAKINITVNAVKGDLINVDSEQLVFLGRAGA